MTPELRDWINSEIQAYLPSDRVRQGDKILFRCPICGDSKRNSKKMRGYYYLSNASYHCFNCDANLSGMKLLQAFSGEDYDEIRSRFFKVMFDGKHYGSLSSSWSVHKEENRDNILQFKSVLKPEWKHPLSEKAETYLRDRLVLDAPFLSEKLYSYIAKNGGEYILIPWRINGVDAYFQLNDFLRIGKGGMKYIFPKDKDKLIYGLDNIDISFPYIICFEGVYDSLFVPNGVAIGGKNLTNLQERILRKRFPNHRVVFALDNDRPGLEATARAMSGQPSSCMFFKWFGDSTKEKDINDYVKSRGKTDLFTDRKAVESMFVDSITMKLWLSRKGFFGDGKGKQAGKQGKVRQRKDWSFRSHASGEVQRAVPPGLQVCA